MASNCLDIFAPIPILSLYRDTLSIGFSGSIECEQDIRNSTVDTGFQLNCRIWEIVF